MFYPGIIVEVLLVSGKYQPIEFILDSGADCTVVPHFVSHLTGNQLPPTPDAHMIGIAGVSMPCYKGNLSLKIGAEKFNVRCLFTESDKAPILIGRIDFFSRFQVLFDGNSCNIVLTKRESLY